MPQSPVGLALDRAGNLHIADAVASRAGKVDANGNMTTVGGNGGFGFHGDGPAASAELSEPWGVAVDQPGNLYIADIMAPRARCAEKCANP